MRDKEMMLFNPIYPGTNALTLSVAALVHLITTGVTVSHFWPAFRDA